MRRHIPHYEFAKAIAEAGLIAEDMLDMIADMGITMHPGNVATLEISLILDERIYDIIDPKKLKVSDQEQEPEAEVQDV
jgi:hypothetical protein